MLTYFFSSFISTSSFVSRVFSSPLHEYMCDWMFHACSTLFNIFFMYCVDNNTIIISIADYIVLLMYLKREWEYILTQRIIMKRVFHSCFWTWSSCNRQSLLCVSLRWDLRLLCCILFYFFCRSYIWQWGRKWDNLCSIISSLSYILPFFMFIDKNKRRRWCRLRLKHFVGKFNIIINLYDNNMWVLKSLNNFLDFFLWKYGKN